MRKIIVCVFCCACFSGYGQTQELEQLRINLEKLVQLKLMLSQAKQGYQMLERGYNSVRDQAKGNFSLHKNHLDGLLHVSEKVARAPALGRLAVNHASAQTVFRQWLQQARSFGLFNAKEIAEMVSEYERTAGAIADDKEQLRLVISNGVLRMSDAERIAIIEALAVSSEGYVAAARESVRGYQVAAVTRAQSKKDIKALKRLYGM